MSRSARGFGQSKAAVRPGLSCIQLLKSRGASRNNRGQVPVIFKETQTDSLDHAKPRPRRHGVSTNPSRRASVLGRCLPCIKRHRPEDLALDLSLAAQAMRFKPWMLAPQPKRKAGPWSALPPPVLAALTSANPSPMVRGYMINGSWPGATRTQPAAAAPEPEQQQEPQTTPKPALAPEPNPTDEASSLSLTIRVVQPTEETKPAESPLQQSSWHRFLQAIKRKAA